jgi:hypothetical protein
VPTTIPLSPTTSLDLSWLPEGQRADLLSSHARGLLDLRKKAQELHIDAGALEATLEALGEATRTAAEDGNAVTISHTQTTSLGRTEVMMGNTDRARIGKFSKSQTGEIDWTPIYVIVAIIALAIVAASALA